MYAIGGSLSTQNKTLISKCPMHPTRNADLCSFALDHLVEQLENIGPKSSKSIEAHHEPCTGKRSAGSVPCYWCRSRRAEPTRRSTADRPCDRGSANSAAATLHIQRRNGTGYARSTGYLNVTVSMRNKVVVVLRLIVLTPLDPDWIS